MTESPYGPHASPRPDGALSRSGEHPPYGQPHAHAVQAYVPAPGSYGTPTNIYVAEAPKSVGVAFVLTFFFGCFGMFYSTTIGALVMLAAVAGLTVLALVLYLLFPVVTLGFGAFVFGLALCAGLLTWPVSIIWGCLAASSHNEKLRIQAQQAAQAAYRPGC